MRLIATALAAFAVAALAAPASAATGIDATGTVYSTDRVVIPMVNPVVGNGTFTDTFLVCRSDCTRLHMGQDLMGPKMAALVATFDGTITSLQSETTVGGGNYLTLTGDRGASAGWTSVYLHINNDTPGTDDGLGTKDWAFAKGIKVGTRVLAGQLLGWRGDSGNAESTGAHLHYELRHGTGWSGTVYNAYPSLVASRRIAVPTQSGPHPDGSLLRNPTGTVFLVAGGIKRSVSAGVLSAGGWSTAQVVAATAPEFLHYRTGPALPLPDGALVSEPTGAVWRVSGATRFRVAPAVGQRVRLVALSDLTGLAIVAKPATPFTPGVLVRLDGRDYAVSGGRLRAVNGYVLASWGWTGADAVVVTTADPLVPPLGTPMPPRDGTLVNVGGVGAAVLTGNVVRRLWDVREIASYGYAGKPRLNYPGSLVAGWRTGEIAGP